MYKVGWVVESSVSPDTYGHYWSIKNFLDAKPDDIEVVWLTGEEEAPPCDAYLIHSINTPKKLPLVDRSSGKMRMRPVIMYAHRWDIWAFSANLVIYQSPLHTKIAKFGKSHVLPPPISDSEIYSGESIERQDKAIWIGRFNKETAPDIAVRWAEINRINTDFFGYDTPTDNSHYAHFMGRIHHDNIPAKLQEYKQFIFFPRAPQPFNRVMAEALLNGCELNVWGDIGIDSFEEPIEKTLERCRTSANEYWNIVREHLPKESEVV